MEEINLYDLLRYYARNWLNLLSAVLIGAIIGVVYTAFIQTPLYKSDATMLVVGARTSSTDNTINNNYTELFKSRLVLESTIETQGYSGDYEQLLARTTATNDKNTDVIKVSIADTEPKESQRLLSVAVEAFKSQASKIYGSNNIKTVDNATLPTKPYNVNIITQVGLAMAAAFFLAIIVLFFTYDYATSYKGGKGGKSGGNGKGSKASARTKTATVKLSPARKKPATKLKGKSAKKSESYVRSLARRARAALLSGDNHNQSTAKAQSKG